MTNQEKYDLIKEVCDTIRASLQHESERLTSVADGWKNKNSAMYDQLLHDSTMMVNAQICVHAAQAKMENDLFKKVTKDDDIVIGIEDKP